MTVKTARHAALDYLARRDYTEKELQQRLTKAGYSSEDIQQTLHALRTEKLLNHARFIENYIHFRRKKGFGPLRIRAELTQRGLTEDTFLTTLNIEDAQWYHEAQSAWEKRFKKTRPATFTEQAKQMRFLQGRGFTTAQIEAIFKNTFN